jgi:hypothetical protein
VQAHQLRERIGGVPTLTTTHLAAVILLGLLLDLDWNEWFVALLFGVALDIDHLFAAPGYIGRNGFGAILAPTWDDGSGAVWRSFLHYPMGVFIVMPLAMGWRLMVPLVFWVSHLSIDHLQNATLAHSALVESVFLLFVCSGIFALGYYRWRAASGHDGLMPYLVHIKAMLLSYIDGSRRTTRGTAGRT